MSLESLQQLFETLNVNAHQAYVKSMEENKELVRKELEKIHNTSIKGYMYHQMITPDYGKIDNLEEHVNDVYVHEHIRNRRDNRLVIKKDVVMKKIMEVFVPTKGEYIIDVCTYHTYVLIRVSPIGVSPVVNKSSILIIPSDAVNYLVIVTNLGNIYTFSVKLKPIQCSDNYVASFELQDKIMNNVSLTDSDVDVIKSFPIKKSLD